MGADIEKAKTAALLAKTDLLTEVVGEFPETQGLMGKYYALAQGEDASVAAAIEEHYKPVGPNDRVPTDPVSIAVALADKVDTLVGFWAIDEKPTGSKDPYALRRAALGVIRIVLENQIRLSLLKSAWDCSEHYLKLVLVTPESKQVALKTSENDLRRLQSQPGNPLLRIYEGNPTGFGLADLDILVSQNAPLFGYWQAIENLLSFFFDRLKVQLRDQGARHDLVDAVLAQHGEGHDDLLLIVRRVEALGKFLSTDDGKSLLAGVKRATNILRIEEKKDGTTYHGRPDNHLYLQPEERQLAAAINAVKEEAAKAVAREDFEGAMAVIAKLRPDVDAFFDKVTVNVEMGDRRENRLKLLNEIREATAAVADFSKIEG